MYIEQIYTNCLSEAAYYIESNGEAAIIDPLRETDQYIKLAESRGAKIKYIFETHFHADFVSGHLDLARKTGGKIVFGPTAKADFEILVAEDDQSFSLGDIELKLLHTPGHTLESSCILLLDKEGNQHSVFTGDTLFIGDVGRPDLAVKTDLSREDLARHLYHSINEKLLTLDDTTIIYPGHGAGSLCGKNLSSEKQSTIGDQKKFNYALQEDSEEGFVKAVTAGLNAPPQYFPKNAVINKSSYSSFESILSKSLNPLTPLEFVEELSNLAVIVIDTRSAEAFSEAHIPESYYFGLEGSYAVWVGTIIENLSSPILLVCDEGKAAEAITRLARVGYENVIGYLEGGFEAWTNAEFATESIPNISPSDFNNNLPASNIIDVRTITEHQDGSVPNATNIPLAELKNNLNKLSKQSEYHVFCRSGYRSMIANSILKRNGFTNIINVSKGYSGIIGQDENESNSCSLIKEEN